MQFTAKIHTTVRDFARVKTKKVFAVHAKEECPRDLVLDWFEFYIQHGTREQCASHPMLRDHGNEACALLTYKYLRPHSKTMVDDWRVEFIARQSLTVPPVFSDEVCEIFELE